MAFDWPANKWAGVTEFNTMWTCREKQHYSGLLAPHTHPRHLLLDDEEEEDEGEMNELHIRHIVFGK